VLFIWPWFFSPMFDSSEFNWLALLGNPSFSAFLGAFSAFLLVVLADWWREVKKKQQVIQLLQINRRLLLFKVIGVQDALDRIDGGVNIDAGVRFSVSDIKRLSESSLNRFGNEEKFCLDVLCHQMDGVDAYIGQVLKRAEEWMEAHRSGQTVAAINQLPKITKEDLTEVLANLHNLDALMGLYLDGKFSDLMNTKLPIRPIKEPILLSAKPFPKQDSLDRTL